MRSHYTNKYLVTIVIFVFTSAILPGQNKSGDAYVPEVGQQGKDVVWVPTPQELVDTMLSIAKVTPADFVIDLGSGDGRTVISAAKRGAKALGIEYNPDMVALSRRNAQKEGVSGKAEFIEADLYEADLSKASVITMFLLPEINLKLRPRILELKPGTRIVSNTFTMGEWEADREVTTDDNWNSWNTALLWIVPAKVEGIWKLGKDELVLTQEFQFIRGKLNHEGKSINVTDGRLNGSEITFRAGDYLYTGKITSNKMSGKVANSALGNSSDWVATR
ncbi:MAG TPA: SAM-dependent methyltransferase [Bacteroidales bacterium]|nr:SAM-dependent methyltransferase [Bacteroidales bacterium]